MRQPLRRTKNTPQDSDHGDRNETTRSHQRNHKQPTFRFVFAALLLLAVMLVLRSQNVVGVWKFGVVTSGKSSKAPASISTAATTTSVEHMTVEDIRTALIQAGDTPLFNPNNATTAAETAELYQRLDKIRYVCGDLCRIQSQEDLAQLMRNSTGGQPYLDIASMPHCPSVLALEELDASSMRCKEFASSKNAADYFPPDLLPYYTLDDDTMSFRKANKPRCDIYMDTTAGDKKLWATGHVWKQTDIKQAMQEIRQGAHFGSYGVDSVNYVKGILEEAPVQGQHILVIGSSAPWLEATLLVLGATKVTTLEYGALVSEHPQIDTMTPDVFRKRYQDGTLSMFDAVVHHSSLEHSGLGRYGDALNPWGDILAMARAWCVTKPGGWLYAGLPSACHSDEIMSNWHRIYGKWRWPWITSGWMPLSSDYASSFDLPREKGCIWGDTMGGQGFLFRKREMASSNEV